MSDKTREELEALLRENARKASESQEREKTTKEGGPLWWTPERLGEFEEHIRTGQLDKNFHKAFGAAIERRLIQGMVDEMFRAHEMGEEPLKLVTEEDILNRPAPEWWIEGLLQKGTVAVFAGEAGLGKTFMSIHMSRTIAAGTPWFGNRTVRQGTVLYVAAEGASAFGKRVRAWDSIHPVRPAPNSIHYLESGVNLVDEQSITRLEALLDDLQPDIIILDTLSQLAAIDNENDAAQMAKVFRTAKRLRDHKDGSTVLLVHHVNKGAGGVRGSSVIRSNADTVIVAKSGKAGDFFISTEIGQDGKQKDGAPLKMEGFKLTDAAGSAVVTQDRPEPDPDLEKLRDLFKTQPEYTKTELRLAFGIPKADNSDPEYKRWDRKWKAWTKDGVAILVSEDAKSFKLLELAA